MTSLVEKVVALHELLEAEKLPHAFGGALALAWCTREPRGTSDVDINVFVPADDADRVLAAMSSVVVADAAERESLVRDGQVRLWWGVTPIDLFLNNTAFHDDVALRTRRHDFAGKRMPFLSCDDLAVFKAFFNRPKDWVDIDTMISARTVRIARVSETLTTLLGPDDERVNKVRDRQA